MLEWFLRPAHLLFRRYSSIRIKNYAYFYFCRHAQKNGIPCQFHVDTRKRLETALILLSKYKDEEEEIKLIVVKAPPGASESSVSGKVEWTKTVGAHVRAGELVCRIKFKDGRSIEITAPVEGVIAVRNKRENDPVQHGDELFKVRLDPEGGKRVFKKKKLQKKDFMDFDDEDMKSLLDSEKVLPPKGTNKKEAATATTKEEQANNGAQKPVMQQKPNIRSQTKWAQLTPQNAVEASVNPIPQMMTAMDEINIENALKFLNNYETSIFLHKPCMQSVYIKAAAFVLKMKPSLNITIQNEEKLQKSEIDITIAIRHLQALAYHKFENVENISYFDIGRVISEIKRKMSEGTYRQGRTSSRDFTISQEWQIGSVFGTPYHSETCTLGLHKCIKRPVLSGTQLISAPMMYVSLTYNNSLINDKDVVDFLKIYKLAIEEPRYILVNKN